MNKHKQLSRGMKIGFAIVTLPSIALAAGKGSSAPELSVFSSPLFCALLFLIILLAVIIISLSSVLKNIVGSDVYGKRLQEKKASTITKTAAVVAFILMSQFTFAQQASSVRQTRVGGLDTATFWSMISVIGLELIILVVLFSLLKRILTIEKTTAEIPEPKKVKTLFEKLNYKVEIEEEATIMLDHDYDGIKELDNDLPPWWKYGFYLTILISVIYMINYHVAKTSPLQAEEYQRSVIKAEAEIAEYMRNSANNVDETTVKMLNEPSELAAGKSVYLTNCSTCHGKGGEGGVGPNISDEYWMHGGSIKDIFKSIKYGWTDKGMKAWKEDLSPVQIAQITSFIRTLKGTNPPGAKEKQGDLYIEAEILKDSLSVTADTSATAMK